MSENTHRRQIQRKRAVCPICWIVATLLSCLSVTATRAEPWTATVDWAQQLELGPLVGGTVTATYAEIGDRVTAGMELMRVDPAPYLHEVQAVEAQVESTRADVESSRQHHERQEELYDIGSLSTVQLEDSGYSLKRMESAHRLAQARLEIARYNLDKTATRAPFEAWVIDKRVFVGQNLSTSQAIPVSFVVAPAGRYIAITNTVQANAVQEVTEPVEIGRKVNVEINGKTYPGTVTFPSLSNPPAAGGMTISFSDDSLLLLPGTQVSVSLNQP